MESITANLRACMEQITSELLRFSNQTGKKSRHLGQAEMTCSKGIEDINHEGPQPTFRGSVEKKY